MFSPILVMGWGQIFLTQVVSGRVSHLWLGFGKFSPQNFKFFNFSLRIKKNLFGLGQEVSESKSGQPHIYCRSGQSPSLLRGSLPNICFRYCIAFTNFSKKKALSTLNMAKMKCETIPFELLDITLMAFEDTSSASQLIFGINLELKHTFRMS